jgi:peptidoglycan/xylan/chitin deacetylase (PgdA/CDA1 family)
MSLQRIWEKNWPEVHAAITGGLPKFVFASAPGELGDRVPVFFYHLVDDAAFEEDLAFLARNGYRTIGADRLLDHIEMRQAAPERAVVLTFDDGPKNLYDVAYPALKRHGMEAVAFICPGFHGEPSEEDANGKDGRAVYPCDWGQIGEMHNEGVIDFQSHTYMHRYLPRWPEDSPLIGVSDMSAITGALSSEPPSSIEDDFRLAKSIIEKRLDKRVNHLAFPRFNGTDEALEAAERCGYRACWWGTLPGQPDNRSKSSPWHVVRLSGEFLRRLPGDERVPLADILAARHKQNAKRVLKKFSR